MNLNLCCQVCRFILDRNRRQKAPPEPVRSVRYGNNVNADSSSRISTLQGMTDLCARFLVEEGLDEATARQMLGESLPLLKRWSTGGCS